MCDVAEEAASLRRWDHEVKAAAHTPGSDMASRKGIANDSYVQAIKRANLNMLSLRDLGKMRGIWNENKLEYTESPPCPLFLSGMMNCTVCNASSSGQQLETLHCLWECHSHSW